MKNLTHVGSEYYSSTTSTINNMADEISGGGAPLDWIGHLRSETFSTCVPLVDWGHEVVDEDMWNPIMMEDMMLNNSVAEGMGRNDVAEGMGNRGAEFMVGAAGSISQPSPSGLREQGPLNNDHLRSVPFSAFVPLVEAGHEVYWGMLNNWVEEGMSNNGVVEDIEKNCVGEESMGKKGVEFTVAAAGSSSQRSPPGLREQGPVTGFEFGVGDSSMTGQVPRSAVKVRNKKGAERKAARAPPGSRRQRSPSGSKEMAGGGSNVDYSKIESHIIKSVVGVEAPQGMVNLQGDKRGADRMGAAPPGALGSKRQRSPSGWIETSGGSNDEAMGNEALLDELAALANVGNRKRPWVKERKDSWWDKVVNSPGYTDENFKRDFHMSRFTFDTLCDKLGSSVAKQDTAIRDAIPVRQRVAVAVYRYATGETFRDLEKRFGIGLATCQKIFLAVTNAINAIFQAETVSAQWPDSAHAMDAAAAKFHGLTGGIPGVIGAVYTTHVQIVKPMHHAGNYYNRRLAQRREGKASFSVSLQAAVDANGAFTDLCIGNPGATSDEEIFLLSSMSTTHVGEMLANGKRLVGGTGYPLTDWTLVPYTDSNLTPPQETFNQKVALARGVALDAFRRLKARWACLQMCGTGNLKDFLSAMAACCVLHNLCERWGDQLGDELKGYKLEDDEIVLHNRERSAAAAAQVRDVITHKLYHHAGAGSSMPA